MERLYIEEKQKSKQSVMKNKEIAKKKKKMNILIIVKTAMDSKDFVKINQLLKQVQGEKYYPNIFKVANDKSNIIIDYLEKEKLIYEIYTENE